MNTVYPILALILIIIYFLLPPQSPRVSRSNTTSRNGRVVDVIDGDTIRIEDDFGKTHGIRLNEIDAPERFQAFGVEARKALVNKVYGTDVSVECFEHDSYGRILGKVYKHGRWINREMVAEGWAWHVDRYSDDVELAQAEQSAQKASRGLWAGRNPVPPWEYRRIKRTTP